MPPTVSRRALLRSGGLVGLAGLLAACDGSEGPDSTSPTGAVEPDDPTTWPPDTTLLLSARRRVHGYLAALEASEEIEAYQTFVETFGLGYEVEVVDDVDMPAYTGPLELRHAEVRTT